MVSQQLIKKLKEIIKSEYGQDLEYSQVADIANNVVGYYDLLAKIYHRQKSSEDNNP